MILLVDAYNVIRFLYPGGRHAYEAQVTWFLSKLSAYRKLKKSDIQDIIVVFDGGTFSHKTREIVGGLVVMYAGVRRKADDVLAQYAQELRERAVLISNDRELGRRVAVHRSAIMGVHEFWQLVVALTAKAEERPSGAHRYGNVEIIKYEDEAADEALCDVDALDGLMIEGSMTVAGQGIKDDSSKGPGSRTSGSAVSKSDKMRSMLRKKLG